MAHKFYLPLFILVGISSAVFVLGHLNLPKELQNNSLANLAFLSYLSLYLSTLIYFCFSDFLLKIRKFSAKTNIFLFQLINLPLTLFFIFAIPDSKFLSGILVVAFFILPSILILQACKNQNQCTIYDILFLLSIWIPIHSKLAVDSFSYPDTSVGGMLFILATTVFLSFCAISVRKFEDVGLPFTFDFLNFKKGTVYFILTIISLVSIGLIFNFIEFAPKKLNGFEVLGGVFLIFIFVSLPEELFFRGLLLNILEKTSGSPRSALFISSLIFGLSHLNFSDSPNIFYGILAAIAGFFYGKTYMETNSLFMSALVHTGVNAIWLSLFTTNF